MCKANLGSNDFSNLPSSSISSVASLSSYEEECNWFRREFRSRKMMIRGKDEFLAENKVELAMFENLGWPCLKTTCRTFAEHLTVACAGGGVDGLRT